MNYSIELRMELPEKEFVSMGELHTIPWENRDLVEASSGLSFVNGDSVGLASSIVAKLEKGIWELTNCPDCYQQYEVKHGLGTVKEMLAFYRNMLQDCRDHPFASLYGEVTE